MMVVSKDTGGQAEYGAGMRVHLECEADGPR